MDIPTRISLVRHGRVDNPRHLFYGRLPGFRLSAEGLAEARAAAADLADRGVDALYTSPLLRARQTAREIARPHPGLRPRVSVLLNEVKCPYDGRPAAAADARGGDVYAGAGKGFEQPVDVLARLARFLERACREHPGRHVVAVTHGDPIAFLALWAAGRQVRARDKARLAAAGIPPGYPATGSITVFTVRGYSGNNRVEVTYRQPRPGPA